jgi:hypothetical protein
LLSLFADLYRVFARRTIWDVTTSGAAAKTIFFVMAGSTLSLTALALPAARLVAAALPVPSGRPFSASSLRGIALRSHARFGDIAAEIACGYLKKFGNVQASTLPAKANIEQGRITAEPVADEPQRPL